MQLTYSLRLIKIRGADRPPKHRAITPHPRSPRQSAFDSDLALIRHYLQRPRPPVQRGYRHVVWGLQKQHQEGTRLGQLRRAHTESPD